MSPRRTLIDARLTHGSDKGYEAAEFIEAQLDMKVLPHVAQNTSNRKSAVPKGHLENPLIMSDFGKILAS